MSAATERTPTIAAKPFHPFRTHRDTCERCMKVDVDQPRTLVTACLEGSRMLKDAYAEHWKGRAA